MAGSSVKAEHNTDASRDAGQPTTLSFPINEIRRERSPVVVKADLLPAVSVLSMVGLVGILLGWLWSILAPPQRVRVFPNNRYLPLEPESWHRFDDVAIFGFLCLAAGIIIGVIVWLLRERRGPVILLAAVAGGVLSAWLGTKMGAAFAESQYAVEDAPAIGDVVAQAPQLELAVVLIVQPFGTALAYGILTLWNGTDDLGRRLG